MDMLLLREYVDFVDMSIKFWIPEASWSAEPLGWDPVTNYRHWSPILVLPYRWPSGTIQILLFECKIWLFSRMLVEVIMGNLLSCVIALARAQFHVDKPCGKWFAMRCARNDICWSSSGTRTVRSNDSLRYFYYASGIVRRRTRVMRTF